MKTTSSFGRHRYLARAGFFLVVVALTAGMVGCGLLPYPIPGPIPPIPDPGPSVDLEIRTWHDLDAVKDNLAGHHRLMNSLNATTPGYEELASPTANEGKGWQPIGTADPYDHHLYLAFTGTFDGQGYEIADLFIGRPDRNGVGLFGYVAREGVIRNMGVVNAYVTGGRAIGALVANNGGSVVNCYSSGNMAGDWSVGGLVGANSGTIDDCYSTANVTGNHGEAGGLVGHSRGAISNSHSTGSVTGGWWGTGGLVGGGSGTVSNSYATGTVTGENHVGGLVGLEAGTVVNSYYNYDEVLINGGNVITIGALFGEDFEEWLANGRFLDINGRLPHQDGYYVVEDVGDLRQLLAFGQDGSLRFRLDNDLDLGADPNLYIPYLAGEFYGNGHKVSNLSFHSDFVSQVGLFGYLAGGKISAVGVENVNITGHNYVGGLVGYNREGTVSNSYAEGNVAGHQYVGGLVGKNSGGVVAGGRVANCHTTGSVTGSADVGGLLGYLRGGTVSNSYSTAGVSGGRGVGGLVGTVLPAGIVRDSFWDVEASAMDGSAGGTGKTTRQMQDIATFTDTATEGLDEPWDIIAVQPEETNPDYTWNIVDGETYPFLSWEST